MTMGYYSRQDAVVRTFGPDPAPARPQPEGPDFLAALLNIRRNWRSLVLPAAVTVLIAIAYLVLATPQFTSTGLILIDTKNSAAMRSNVPPAIDANVESANIESQVELLKSERILRRVVESEKLVGDPALRDGPVSRAVSAITGTIAFWKHPVAKQPDDEITAAARTLQKLTSVRRIGLTYAVEVAATMPDPAQAARVANAYAAAFIADQMELREEMARRSSKLLQARTDELQAKAQLAERAVEELMFSGSLEGENSASARVTLKKFESSAQAYRVLHDKFLERYAETWQQQFLSLPDAQVASAAYPPQSKSAPRSAVVLAIALFIGLALGLLRIFVTGRGDFSLRRVGA
jgi:uncharacterized protein involved in exopolysaccharide biosynthesis